MAKKKTTVEELKELIESTPKARILTDEQLQIIKDLATDLMMIRRNLEDLEGEDNISKIMFQIGATYNVANKAETVIDELVDSYNEDYDYDSEEDNY
jgi:hypothetical protein